MLSRHLQRTIANIRREPGRHVATSLCLAVAFLAFGAFAAFWWTIEGGVARWGGQYEVTVYLAGDARTEALQSMLEAQPEVSRALFVDGARARDRVAASLPAGSGLEGIGADAFPASFELRLRPNARTRSSVDALAGRLRGAPGVEAVETYGPWLARLRSLATASRVAAGAVGLLALAVAFVVVGFASRLARAERSAETELLRIVGATSAQLEVPLALEGALAGLGGAAAAAALLAVGLGLLRGGGAPVGVPPAWTAIPFALLGAAVGAAAARRAGRAAA
jgi:cell division protein FtsX